MKSLRRRRRACVESTHVRGGPVSTRIRNPTYSSQVKSSKIQRRSRIRILWGACRLENREGAARRNRAEPSARVHGAWTIMVCIMVCKMQRRLTYLDSLDSRHTKDRALQSKRERHFGLHAFTLPHSGAS